MKSPIAKTIPLLARGASPSAAVASGLLSPLALGASGDLDPAFADVGRLALPEFGGPAWSIEPQDDEALFAGGDLCTGFYCYYEYTAVLGRLSETGSLDLGFAAARLDNTEVLDVVLQPDGKAVGVGRTAGGIGPRIFGSALTVFRLEREGALDPTFGDGGIVRLTAESSGRSVALDPDGRIVVAGSREGQLIVLRLLANGAFDDSFGASGIFLGPVNNLSRTRMHLLRTSGGGYRVTINSQDRCRVAALTANGAVDESNGGRGIANLGLPPNASVTCNSMVAQPDDRLLVAGSEDGAGFVVRLLANGARDPDFAPPVLTGVMEDATALAVGGDGSVLVAGQGPGGVSGALLVQLQADGELDVLFGNVGSTWIDMPSDYGSFPIVHDMKVLPDGRVLAAGEATAAPFVVRLLGDTGGDGPGVLGVMHPSVVATEQSQQAVVTVRRMGGASGNVSVGYRTVSEPAFTTPATAGQDYTQVSGRLSWNDGDVSDRQIVVPIADNATPEEHEVFAVALEDAQGGAGLGTRNAIVEISGDGSPFGQFAINVLTPVVGESEGFAQVSVHRNFYASGAVSVTLTPVAGSATPGIDFASAPVTVSWGDGVSSPITVAIAIHDDAQREDAEEFTVALSNPTGGAIVGPRSTAAIVIRVNDLSTSGGGSAGGGGWFGYLSLLWLGVAGLVRSAWMAARSLATSPD